MTAIRSARFEVAPGERGWIVVRHGFGRDSTHATKEAAVQRAVQLARDRQPSELLIRRQDGTVQETRSYGGNIRRILKM